MFWITDLEVHFSRGKDAPLPYPAKLFFLCEKYKVLYAPVAKCACSSLKRLMVDLCEIEHSELLLRHGIHRTTNTFNTGAQLKDIDYQSARRILTDESYYKFAVIRDPVRRVISAYTEKLLRNRTDPTNLACIKPVVQSVREEPVDNMEEGITFREFAQFILRSDAASLDPHWAPQYLSLGGVDVYNEIFTTEQLDQLSERLSGLTGRDFTSAGRMSVSRAQGPPGQPGTVRW